MAAILETWGIGNTWNEIQLLLANVHGKVIDIACGTGKVITLLEPYPALEVHGFDISDFLIQKAIDRGIPRERLTVADATSTPYRRQRLRLRLLDRLARALHRGGPREDDRARRYRITRFATFHLVPISRSGRDEGWMKTHQSFHNNSVEWWLERYHIGLQDGPRPRYEVGGQDLDRQVVPLRQRGAEVVFGLQVLSNVRHWRNARIVDACGDGTRFGGSAQKRGARSRIEIGSACLIDGTLVTEAPDSLVRIGSNVSIGGQSLLAAVKSIIVEDDVLISYDCIITDSDNHSLRYSQRKHDLHEWLAGRHDWSKVATKPVRICKGAWLGARVIVTKGVTVGEGAVCGMGAVVTKDVPPYTVVAGNPARVIRHITDDESPAR